MLTPNTNAGSYLPVAAFLSRCDQRTVGDLCGDAGVRVIPAALPTDPNLAAALLDASGMFEAACTRGQRYGPADIVTMTATPSAGQGFVYRLLTALTEYLLWQRRPDMGPIPETLGWVENMLEQLAEGERVLPFLETQAAGVMTDTKESATDVSNRYLSTREAERLYGRRNNRNRQYPGGFGP